MQRVFTDWYRPRQMIQGIGLTFHPIVGLELKDLVYHAMDGRLSLRNPGNWLMKQGLSPSACEVIEEIYFPCITDGRDDYTVGSPYPQHWKFDPFTGEPL